MWSIDCGVLLDTCLGRDCPLRLRFRLWAEFGPCGHTAEQDHSHERRKIRTYVLS